MAITRKALDQVLWNPFLEANAADPFTAFAFADFVMKKMEQEGKTYSTSAYEGLQQRLGVQKL